ncbi:tigger transposable element-derived protein 1-like isoform X2 [Palaemon carinicauda]|uniref:tigger transposable element-derived protein 1-like isoform X2 n=1 Tax=Palaemon carinicauda TaxID=392227 RepID=UPI0035B62BF1
MDEMGLFWKRVTQETFIAKEEWCAVGYKAAKDRCTLSMYSDGGATLLNPTLFMSPRPPCTSASQHEFFLLHAQSKGMDDEGAPLELVPVLLPEEKDYL